MSEYTFVEKPFLDQLAALGWEVIDHGPHGIPGDPGKSLRDDFRETTLRCVFMEAVRGINTLADGRPWLTDAQLAALHDELTTEVASKPLLEANEIVTRKLVGQTRVVVGSNELTGEEYPEVKLVDWERPQRNRFIAINQFRVDTPGRVKNFIIPDIVLFVNGLPWAVVECKLEGSDPTGANSMEEAFLQLMRYSDQRDDPDARVQGLREGEPRLFHANQLLIRSCGEKADVGSITATDDKYFYPWNEIWPPEQRRYTPPLGAERPQEMLIQGLLFPAILLDAIRHCVLFMQIGGEMAKVIPRYQQYRAMRKIIDRLLGENVDGERSGVGQRSGVVWHTQGSGKSLTMVFTVRRMRTTPGLSDYKIIMVNDRTDLEKQLTETAYLTGEPVHVVEFGGDAMRERLGTTTSDLNMVMVHKFQEREQPLTLPDRQSESGRIIPSPQRQQYALAAEPLPEYRVFETVNDSEKIALFIDEAHRTQSSDLGDNLFAAFPNAARIAFTGTPLITERHGEHRTVRRFGTYIDRYKLMDSVADGVTIPIEYTGKTAHTAIQSRDQFERKFEDLFAERTPQELNAIKRRYGTFSDILEAEERIEAIAKDMVEHYITHILPDGFKAQVVASNKLAAVRYKRFIDLALRRWLDRARALPPSGRDPDLIAQVEFLTSAVVVSSAGTNELVVVTAARQHAKEVNAVENFKKPFDYGDPAAGKPPKPETGLAFLVVCDMLLTGFDAPVEQVMYLDRKLREHSLLQAIARVNRVHAGKARGHIVDYIGISNHLSKALEIYAGDDEALQDVMDAMTDINQDIPVLESRCNRIVQFFQDLGVVEIEGYMQQTLADPARNYEVLEQAVQALEDVKQRAEFDALLGFFLQSMNIVLPHPAATPVKIPAKRLGFLARRLRDRYQDTSVGNFAKAGAKVRKLINEHLVSQGVDPKIPPLDLLDPDFIVKVQAQRQPRAKASEMEHAIRRHCKIKFNEDPVLYGKLVEKLEKLIQKHKDDWDALYQAMLDLQGEAAAGRRDDTMPGVPTEQQPYYDLIAQLAFPDGLPDEQAGKLKNLTAQIHRIIGEYTGIVNFWESQFQIGKLKGDLTQTILYSGIEAMYSGYEHIVAELVTLARNRGR
ncbi:MAG: type I restriction endonuclease subunit R [Halieaceae bacterium]|nr:type I restriction endonuclease subunit R [Halieaceae bacterium]